MEKNYTLIGKEGLGKMVGAYLNNVTQRRDGTLISIAESPGELAFALDDGSGSAARHMIAGGGVVHDSLGEHCRYTIMNRG